MRKICLVFLVIVILSGCSKSDGSDLRITNMEEEIKELKSTVSLLTENIDVLSETIINLETEKVYIADELSSIHNQLDSFNTSTEESFDNNVSSHYTNIMEQINYFHIRMNIIRAILNKSDELQVVYGRIQNISIEDDIVVFDDNIWIDVEEESKIEQLGLDERYDFPNSYYLYNEVEGLNEYQLDDEVITCALSNERQPEFMRKTDFELYVVEKGEYSVFCEFIICDGIIISIIETYIP